MQATHVVAVPVAENDVRDRLARDRANLGDDRLSHRRTSARVEQDDALLGDDEHRIAFLRQLERILPNRRPHAGSQIRPGVLEGIRPRRAGHPGLSQNTQPEDETCGSAYLSPGRPCRLLAAQRRAGDRTRS